MLKRTDRPIPPALVDVMELVSTRVAQPDRPVIELFVSEYFDGLDQEDLASHRAEDLYGAALSHWTFARTRIPGLASVRIRNPTIEEHGWQSSHTVIEIVNDDMPFLVDAVTMEVNRHGLALHLIAHPILTVRRDTTGKLVEFPGNAEKDPRESWMHLQIDRVHDRARLQALHDGIARALADTRAAVADWQRMLDKTREVLAEIERSPLPVPPADVAAARGFLEWLLHDHFTFTGYRCHDLDSHDGMDSLRAIPESGLGVLRKTPEERPNTNVARPPAAMQRHAKTRGLLVVTKSNLRSTVHRPGHYDHVGITRFDANGEVCGEHRFIGLFTSSAYSATPSDIPVLKQKVANIIGAAGLPLASHAGRSLTHILNNYPRDELFQISERELLPIALGILQLGERQRFRLFTRRDTYDRFVTCLVFSPREQYTTDLRRKWQAILVDALCGHASEFDVSVTASPLARVLFTIYTTPGQIPSFDTRELEARLAQAARRWEDNLRDALIERLGEARGTEFYHQFGDALPAGYREDFAPRSAVADIEMFVKTLTTGSPGMMLYRPIEAAPGQLRFKLVVKGAPLVLSDVLPMLEHMGLRVLDERPYRIAPVGAPGIWLVDIGLAITTAAEVDVDALRPIFEKAFADVLAGAIESDPFNRLVTGARLPAEDIVVLRAYGRYFRQIGFPLSQSFIENTLTSQPAIARLLVHLFKQRLDPKPHDESMALKIEKGLEAELERISNLSEDRVLRQYLATILATTRTNFFVRNTDGSRKEFLSFKLDPARVPGVPEPRPMFEIFVYSPRFEGVHLRGGKVARGGLRWSDRPEDYRTEVLGLVKAQMVKNTVIVPVGSKGGFVLKRAPAEREELLKEGIACYKNYLRGLLDLTDNLAEGKIVPPAEVRRLDADDPYLVVAADKGTATFSDHANAVAKEYGFWLGDAFASGGSAGYDHKAMAITARGAWESTKRHFRELGRSIRTQPFTAVGIGDMSGDVFGNGMLLAKTLKLIAAFDHRHVFIDPDPDAEASFLERERMFHLPRSSWADYDTKVISAGGGVWPRSAKSIPISEPMQRALGITQTSMTPNELVNAILLAPVDLLYNGGIGTFVKASTESHADAGDRTNDPVRVNGKDLRAKIVVEGGNLGFTQRGRIEFARVGAGGAGGRINTDAIDNSGGVETSDHEVNIKILLGLAMTDGDQTVKQRDALLIEMTDDVAKLVLRDNYFQNQSLSLSCRTAPGSLDGHARFIQFLEKNGRLNRSIEFLPSDEELADRRKNKQGLVIPELAILLAYSKIWLYDELLASNLPDDPWVATALSRYFPKLISDKFAAVLPRHPLKREIITTHVTNSMINRVGSIFVHRLMEATGARSSEIVRAYLIAREVFGYVTLWQSVEALDDKVPEDILAELLLEAQSKPPATSWFLRSKRLQEDMGATIEKFRAGASLLESELPRLLDAAALGRRNAMISRFTTAGIPLELATRVAAFQDLGSALDLVEVADATKRSLTLVAQVHFNLIGPLGLGWFADRIMQLPADGHWPLQAKNALRDDLGNVQRGLLMRLLSAFSDHDDAGALCERWMASNRTAIDRATRVIEELRTVASLDATMLSVALRELRTLS
jgi:glutamate dehydrogenase